MLSPSISLSLSSPVLAPSHIKQQIDFEERLREKVRGKRRDIGGMEEYGGGKVIKDSKVGKVVTVEKVGKVEKVAKGGIVRKITVQKRGKEGLGKGEMSPPTASRKSPRGEAGELPFLSPRYLPTGYKSRGGFLSSRKPGITGDSSAETLFQGRCASPRVLKTDPATTLSSEHHSKTSKKRETIKGGFKVRVC